jgi:hypothetical protein
MYQQRLLNHELKLTTAVPAAKIQLEERRCSYEISLRDLRYAQARREEPQVHNQQDLALAYRMVPWLEGVSKGTGRTKGKS